jgi:hypothetical protein
MTAKTNLQLVQQLAEESGATGSALSISTIVGATGQAKNFVRWIRQAHNDIQNRHINWSWMRSKFSVDTTAGDDTYAATDCTDTRLSALITRFSRWIPLDDQGCSNVKQYLTSAGVGGEIWLVPLPWSYFMSIYRRGTQNNGVPIHFAIDPQDNLVLGPKPDAIYTISGEYQMASKDFTADADTPEFPDPYHDLIWLKAMEKAGRFSAAPEVLARGQVDGKKMMAQLEANQLPEIFMAEPLA